MKKITEMNLSNKKVILRCDFNISIQDGQIANDDRIMASLETINYLLKQNSKIIIMSHLGKVKTNEDKEKYSLKIVYNRLKELLPNIKVIFCPVTSGKELEDMVTSLNHGEILLMENTRFEDINNKKESSNDLTLAKYWASLGDVFINDAFGMTHRKHASNNGISNYLETGIGFLIEKELNGLELLINPINPFTVIMGGAKVGDKIKLISNILKKCDYLLLGGGIANTFLSTNNNVGGSLVSEESIEDVKQLLKEYSDKIILPIDSVVLSNDKVEVKKITDILSEDIMYDIGPETISLYERYINLSELIFVNGTVGLYEDERFSNGTKSILEISVSSKAKVILGGGDALASSSAFNIEGFYFSSTGGGATLDYIGTEKLACLED